MNKICVKCKQEKEVNLFYRYKTRKDGLHPYCKSCLSSKKYKDRAKEYRKENKERINKKVLEWQKNNKENCRIACRKWYKKNKKKVYEYNKKYLAERPGKMARDRNIRRARIKGGGGSYTIEEWTILKDKYDNKCLACKEIKPLESDHVIPILKSGNSNIDNIQPLCRQCNMAKHVKIIDYRL